MDLESAIQRHTDWKIKFRTAINKKEVLDAKMIAKDNQCILGKWLQGEAKEKFGHLQSYTECVALHTQFHHEAGKIATAINRKRYEEATQLISAETPYTLASGAVIRSILKFKKEANI